MNETPQRADEPTTNPTSISRISAPRTGRLYRAAAWVAIAAGSVFIAGSLFMTGFVLGGHGGQGGHGHTRAALLHPKAELLQPKAQRLHPPVSTSATSPGNTPSPTSATPHP